jgi:pimeloyl-ACP methyl ester carboxylesterase
MPGHLTLSEGNALYYEHEPRAGKASFVFVNALTGNTQHWEAVVAPLLREAGFGTLSYNFRGQAESAFTPETELDQGVIVGDLQRLLCDLAPEKPILVGLSIGGLFAAHALLGGSAAKGLVLLNTLRKIGPRIAWVNDALPAMVGQGGVPMFMDAVMPMLVGPEFLASARSGALQGNYAPMDPAHGHMNLMRNSTSAEWDIDWSALDLPVLNITGLHDRVFLDREVVDTLYATLPDARREDWDDAGHLLPLERPEKLAASLIRFGQEIEGRA